MILGRIKCFFEGRGYGFIEDYDGNEVYFHLSSVQNSGGGMEPQREIVHGANCYFDIIKTEMGMEALSVRLA